MELAESTQPFLIPPHEGTWIEMKDGNASCRAMYRRHYSRYVYADGRSPALFVGPGFKVVLMTPDAKALFVWRKFRDLRDEEGVNCAVFRNEGAGVASELITAADEIAWEKWPGERLYTYVNAEKVQHKRQPGRCFLKAGWRYVKDAAGMKVKTVKSGLYILEIRPEWRQAA